MATERDKVNVGAIATLVAVGAIGLLAIVAVLTALVRQELAADQERKGGLVNTRPYRDLKASQLAELTEEAKWLDKGKGVLSIPIARSMELIVGELRRDPESATPADAGSEPDAGATGPQLNVPASDGGADGPADASLSDAGRAGGTPASRPTGAAQPAVSGARPSSSAQVNPAAQPAPAVSAGAPGEHGPP